MVVGGADDALVEEREGHLVAGAVDDRVDLVGRPVDEEDLGPLEAVDVGQHGDVAVAEPGQQVVADRGVGVQHLVVRPRQAVVGDLALREPQHRRHRQLLHAGRHPRDDGVGEVVGGHPEHELRHDVRTAAHGEVGPRRDPRGLHRDVGRGVADAQHQHAFPGEGVGGLVVVRVDLRAGEGLGAGERRLGPARVPVVAVGDHDVLVEEGLRLRRLAVRVARADGDGVAPAPLRAGPEGLDLDHLGAEPDPVAQAEVVHEVVEVRGDLPVARVVRQVLGHRVGGVLHQLPGGVDVQRPVGRGQPVVVVVAPVAADLAAHLEHVDLDAAGGQHLGGGDARRAGSDDADGLDGPVHGARSPWVRRAGEVPDCQNSF